MGYAQSLPIAATPAVARLGTYSSQPHHALQAAANQAALGTLKSFAAAVYSERRFLLQELSTYHIGIAQPVADGAFALQAAYTGTADYTASKIGVAYGRKLGNRVSVGVQFNYWNQHIRGYGNAAQITAEGGVLVRLTTTFHMGFQACNPAGVVFTKWDRNLPAVYTIGAGYEPSEQVAITIELRKAERLPLAVQTGIEYRFTPTLWAKAGIESGTAAFFIAAGFQLKDFRIEVAGAVHPQLGLSPGLLLAYNGMGK